MNEVLETTLGELADMVEVNQLLDFSDAIEVILLDAGTPDLLVIADVGSRTAKFVDAVVYDGLVKFEDAWPDTAKVTVVFRS